MPKACACNEFSRAELMRGAVATAGGGLPSIEPGMPLPAGTGLSRRSFLARGAGLSLAVFGGGALAPQAFEEGISRAWGASSQKILVSIFMAGGVDSMSLLAPVGYDRYRTLRTSLAIADNGAHRFSEDPKLQWHPSALPLRDLHAAGKLTVLPSVGYTSPNQSHFTSRHFWEVGELDPGGRVGWMGRYLDRYGAGDQPLQGLSIGWNLAPSLAPSNVPVAAVGTPENYDLWTRNVWSAPLEDKLLRGLGGLGGLETADRQLGGARAAARMTSKLRDDLAPISALDVDALLPSYPQTSNPFPRRLATLAAMISADMPVRCVAIEANGGYDTHDNQNGSLPGDLDLFSRSLAAFQADLERRGMADRVLVHVWSEFGRRAEQNGNGTDHGAAGISFVMGTQASGRMVGEFPGLTNAQLDRDGNLKHTSDFRAVYKTLIENWLGGDATGIIPDEASFAKPVLVKSQL